MNENEIELAKEQKEELIQNTIEKMNDAIDATMEYRFGEDWKNIEIEGFIENPNQGGFNDFSHGVDLDTVADLYKEKAEDFIREVASDFKADEDGFRDYSEKYDNKEDLLASLEATLNEQATYSNFSDSHNGAIDDMYNSNFSKHDSFEEAVSVGKVELASSTDDEKVLEVLSRDSNTDVQFAVANNENTSAETLQELTKSSDDDIHQIASENLDKKLSEMDPFEKYDLAASTSTSEALLDKLSEDKDDYIKATVANNENTSMETLEKLAKNEDELVSSQAIANIETRELSQETSFSKDQIDNSMEARENGSLERLEGETKEFELARDIASITDKNSGETEYVSSKEAFSQMIEDQSIDRDKIFEAANNLQNTGELEKAGEERLFNNAYEAVQNEGIDKSNEGLAIDTVKEFNTAYGNEASNERLAEMANDKFGTEFKAEDIQEIKNLDEKQMNGDVQIDRKEDLDMEKVKDLNSGKEIEVQGDHATVKEQTMAGEASERVVSREGGLDELDKTVGKDSDKVETKEESEKRDGLSAKEEEILKSINEDRKGSLNDAIDEYKSDSSNREVSVSQGQNNAESTKQK